MCEVHKPEKEKRSAQKGDSPDNPRPRQLLREAPGSVIEDVNPEIGDVKSLEERFNRLADRWEAETALDSTAQQFLHPDYQTIIEMGMPVVPYILKRLKHKPDHWFEALCAITGENPVPEDCAGDLPKRTACWLAWGKAHGLI